MLSLEHLKLPFVLSLSFILVYLLFWNERFVVCMCVCIFSLVETTKQNDEKALRHAHCLPKSFVEKKKFVFWLQDVIWCVIKCSISMPIRVRSNNLSLIFSHRFFIEARSNLTGKYLPKGEIILMQLLFFFFSLPHFFAWIQLNMFVLVKRNFSIIISKHRKFNDQNRNSDGVFTNYFEVLTLVNFLWVLRLISWFKKKKIRSTLNGG